jgi:hypothetical protein
MDSHPRRALDTLREPRDLRPNVDSETEISKTAGIAKPDDPEGLRTGNLKRKRL